MPQIVAAFEHRFHHLFGMSIIPTLYHKGDKDRSWAKLEVIPEGWEMWGRNWGGVLKKLYFEWNVPPGDELGPQERV